ncbi:MAG: SDR family NAD(P)-dependent oxidoreductase [Parasphingopyxis sp.]|uniref:SDR family NAD(P)-dependent oxidoreductase n=1 Tax=Parasphingopyxis sp. TaxID=1920299 RepID=UPI003FA0EC78
MPDTPFDLSGRVALVTGASSGLGAGFARLLARAGAKVVLGARRKERLEALAEEIGDGALAVGMDVADEDSVIAAYDAAEAAFGTVDAVVANAGMSNDALALSMAVEAFDAAMAVNLRGAFLTAREGARRLIAAERDNGRIVLISSITAFEPSPGLSAYAASKAGVSQLGKTLAREWLNKGINVNMILPGYIRTELNQDWFDSAGGQKQIARFNRRRLMPQEGLDGILLYLCADESAYVTGAEFVMDDGQTL